MRIAIIVGFVALSAAMLAGGQSDANLHRASNVDAVTVEQDASRVYIGIKTFGPYYNIDDTRSADNEINNWLRDHPYIQDVSISQAIGVGVISYNGREAPVIMRLVTVVYRSDRPILN